MNVTCNKDINAFLFLAYSDDWHIPFSQFLCLGHIPPFHSKIDISCSPRRLRIWYISPLSNMPFLSDWAILSLMLLLRWLAM